MTDPLSSRPVPLEQTREAVVRQLAMHFAVDDLTTEQLEARIDAAHRADSLEALRGIVADLPVIADDAGTAAAAAAPHGRVPAEQVRDRQVIVGVMGGAERKGAWTPARRVVAVAVMGGVDLDFREARFGPGVTEVTVVAIMGGVDIVVAPGVHVESDGIALMGGFGHASSAPGAVPPGAPVLRIGGLALMGGVDVNVRYPGERARDARAREKLERKEARRLGRGR
jgi:hypothetical protein